MNKSLKNISITELRKDLFNTLDDVYLKQEPIIISKSNIPLVVISPVSKDVSYTSEEREELLQAVKDAQGSWKDDEDWDILQAKRDALEKEIAEKLRNTTW